MIYINQHGWTEIGRGKTLDEAIRDARRLGPLHEDDVLSPNEVRADGDIYWTDVPEEGYQV